MKKILITVGTLAFATLYSHAALVYSNSFGYADGPLVTVSAGSPLGVWTTHSGTAGQMDVAAGVVNVSQLESEDVNTVITNATFPVPFTNQVLYAGFKVNFSALPTGAGGYFAHFKDNTTSNFRCRVFATTVGAASGKYRVGIQNFSAGPPVYVTTDLDLGVQYKLVVRFTGSTNSTLWINPISDTSLGNRANATDTTPSSYNGSSTFALRQSTASGDGMGVLAFDDLLIGTAFLDVQTPPASPAISGIPSVSIPANTSTGPLPFIVEDGQTPAALLIVTATSANPTLVPNTPANLTLGGIGNDRTINVTPAAGQEGVASIEVVVQDTDTNTATNTFTVKVGAPSISPIANQVSLTNTVTGPVAFTVNDAETPPGSLTVTATSSDQTVLPDANIGIQNLGGTNRTITLTNAVAGLTTVTVTVNDGTFNISTSFKLTAYPDFGLVLGDDFSYADGSIITNSGFFWNQHSGTTTGQTQVVNGRLSLSNTGNEDINALLTNFPYAASGGVIFFARFVVNFTALPSATGVGEYFAHFKEFANTQFRARIFANTNGAAPGSFRLGIANGGFTTAVFPQDLSLNTSYVVISRYNLSTAESTLWVNPASESSTSVSATDPITTTTIYSYAFRQQTGIGTSTLDDLKIGTTFNSVLINSAPSPEPLRFQVLGGEFILSWSNSVFNLQAAPLVTGVYTNIPGATSPYTNPITGFQKYFRLSN